MPTSNGARSEFHITIGTCSGRDGLHTDLSLVKAALLYGDSATLCSPGSTIALSFLALGHLSTTEQIELLDAIIPDLKVDPAAALSFVSAFEPYKRIVAKKHPTRDELIFKLKLEAEISGKWKEVRESLSDLADRSGASGIVAAIDSGLLELHPLKYRPNVKPEGGPSEGLEDILNDFLEVVSMAISDGRTYPLLDCMAGKLIRLRVESADMTVTEGAIARGRHVGLAADLLQRLPLFEGATVEEILDIRRELERPLVHFRSAMIRFSDRIRSASWGKDFPAEVEQVLLREVEPAILEIEDAVKSNSYIAALVRNLADKPLLYPSGAAFSFLVSQLSALPDIVSQAFGVAASSALIAHDTFQSWKERFQTAEQNQLYFYYEAGQQITRLHER